MAVPTSGTLSMLKLAREAKHGDYNGTQTMGMISLYDMINGGNERGSTVSYPTVNDDCLPNPISRTSNVLPYVGCNTEGCTGGFNIDVYYATSIGDASNLTTGDVLYTNSALTTTLSADDWRQDGFTNTIPAAQRKCASGCYFDFQVNSSGVIQSGFSCGCP